MCVCARDAPQLTGRTFKKPLTVLVFHQEKERKRDKRARGWIVNTCLARKALELQDKSEISIFFKANVFTAFGGSTLQFGLQVKSS